MERAGHAGRRQVRRAVLVACLLWPGLVRADWPTLAANARRTSWVADEVRGGVRPVWYRPIEPYINNKTQVIAAEGKLFISTAGGLYALDAETGDIVWIHPTNSPLGHAPTYADGALFVGSHDRTIHRVDAGTGRPSAGWQPGLAFAGFETNPLVVDGRVYAGNRDGAFYCLDARTGAIIWRYETGAAIRNSAAMDADKVLYFASENLHAYALRDEGAQPRLVWRSDKLLGDTFSTYWPVVYRDWVVFSGGMGYFLRPPFGDGVQLLWDEKDGIDADLTRVPGHEPGDWAPGTVTLDASPILEYYERLPHRRRVFMLERRSGRELTFDADGDGRLEYAPLTFTGVTQSGSKYPPVVGADDVLYTNVALVARRDQFTPLGALAGWKVGTPTISRVMEWDKPAHAGDEPMAFSLGGRLAYWALCGDRESGSFDLTVPFGRPGRFSLFWSYASRFAALPDYQPMYFGDDHDGWGVYGASRGIYGKHGAQNPWVPYRGRIYRVMGNAVVAAAPGGRATAPLALASAPRAAEAAALTAMPSPADVRGRLDLEITRMVAAGHLKPGLFRSNIGDFVLAGNGRADMDQGIYYFANPGETILALVRALPLVSSAVRATLREYIRAEMARFPIEAIAHIGHVDGASRQAADVPPEHRAWFQVDRQTQTYNQQPWPFPPLSVYAAWKYAEVWPDEADRLWRALGPKLPVPCPLPDERLVSSTHVLNAYLAGYRGALELARLAGAGAPAAVGREYDRLLALRIDRFSIDAPFTGSRIEHLRSFAMARQFLYLVPEVGEALGKARRAEVERALRIVNLVTPYWFVAGYDATSMEGTHQQLYDVATLNAYAMVLGAPYRELVRFLDAPAFPTGDLLFIHNLASVLEAASRDGLVARASAGARAAAGPLSRRRSYPDRP